MYTIYIAKATANFGLPATRPIYERALETLPDRETAEMCRRFAALERKLGEIDRARAIYAHASQFCDPRSHADFWQEWNQFESELQLLSKWMLTVQSTLDQRTLSERCCGSSVPCSLLSTPSESSALLTIIADTLGHPSLPHKPTLLAPVARSRQPKQQRQQGLPLIQWQLWSAIWHGTMLRHSCHRPKNQPMLFQMRLKALQSPTRMRSRSMTMSFRRETLECMPIRPVPCACLIQSLKRYIIVQPSFDLSPLASALKDSIS